MAVSLFNSWAESTWRLHPMACLASHTAGIDVSVRLCLCPCVPFQGRVEADFCVKTERTDVVTKCIVTLSCTEMKDKELSKCKS